jgi:hypothetical protein
MALSAGKGRGGNSQLYANWTAETTAGSGSIFRYTPVNSLVAASVQVSGTFGGATVVLQGSNDGTTYATLKDLQGNNLSFTAAGYAEFTSGAAFIKPSISGGAGDSLNIYVSHWAG